MSVTRTTRRRKTHPFGRSWRAEMGQRAKPAASRDEYLRFRQNEINALRERRGLPPIEDAEAAIEWERKLRLGK